MHHTALMMLFYRPVKINLLGNCTAGNLPAVTHQSSVSNLAVVRGRPELRRNSMQTDRRGLTCISSSFDWISGGKSAAPQVKGSNGSAPKRSLPTTTITRSGERALVVSPQRLFFPLSINMTWPMFLTMFCHFTDRNFIDIFFMCLSAFTGRHMKMSATRG